MKVLYLQKEKDTETTTTAHTHTHTQIFYTSGLPHTLLPYCAYYAETNTLLCSLDLANIKKCKC